MAQAYREIKVVTGDFARVHICPVRQYQYGRKKKSKPTAATQEKEQANCGGAGETEP